MTSRLSAATAERLRSATADCLLAEKILEESTARALQGGDIGEVRDRVRRCKDEVGRDLLHPRVLAAAVAYNVAMWNEVAIEIESSRSIDQLTEDLLIGQAEAGQVSPAAAAVQDLSSTGAFADLVEAFAARVAGQPPGDDPAGRVAACLDMKALRVEDADLFVGDDPEPPGDEKGAGEASRLMRSAVVLGLLLGQREEVAPGLEELGLDPELLATSGIEDLAHRMSELARRSFSDSGYSDAFRLSDVKTHSLAAHRKSRPSGGDGLTGASPPASSERSGSSIKLAQMIRDLPPWPVLFAGLLLLGVFSVPTIVSHGVKMDGSSSEFAAISPYIERGRHVGEGEARVFVGRVGDSWSYLDTESRREIVNGIGERLAREDVGRVVLEGARRQIVAEYEDGRIRYLVNRAPGQSLSP